MTSTQDPISGLGVLGVVQPSHFKIPRTEGIDFVTGIILMPSTPDNQLILSGVINSPIPSGSYRRHFPPLDPSTVMGLEELPADP